MRAWIKSGAAAHRSFPNEADSFTDPGLTSVDASANAEAMALDLEPFRVGSLPSLYVLPEFITAAEEQRLLAAVRAAKGKWTSVSGRRLQNHGGIVHKGGLVAAPTASWLEQLVGRLSATGIYGGEAARANHVLINAYQPGEGILPHEDGPLYHPAVAILSLASPAVVRFTQRRRAGAEETTSTGTAGIGPRQHFQNPAAIHAATWLLQ